MRLVGVLRTGQTVSGRVVDDAALDSIVADFASSSAKPPVTSGDPLVGQRDGQPALAWVVGVEHERDGLSVTLDRVAPVLVRAFHEGEARFSARLRGDVWSLHSVRVLGLDVEPATTLDALHATLMAEDVPARFTGARSVHDPDFCVACGGECEKTASWSATCPVCAFLRDETPTVRVAHTADHERQWFTDRVPPWYRMRRGTPPASKEKHMDRPITLTEREARIAERQGWGRDDLAEVSRKTFVQTVARTEERNAKVDAVATTFCEVGKEFGLNPDVYADRQKIGAILARRNHPLARGEVYGSGRR
jgi:hypothetical protein